VDDQDDERRRDAPPLLAGEHVSVEDPLTGVTARGRVEEVADDSIVLELPADAPRRSGRIGLRRLDGDGGAWYAETMCRPGEREGLVVAGLPDVWESDAARRSARVATGRVPLICETFPPNVVRREIVAVDISASGLGATGSGMPLQIGMHVRVTPDMTARFPRWLHAVVVWSAPRPHGGFDLGLRFQPESDDERRLVLAWRDSSLGR
jgi:hypothetical protein